MAPSFNSRFMRASRSLTLNFKENNPMMCEHPFILHYNPNQLSIQDRTFDTTHDCNLSMATPSYHFSINDFKVATSPSCLWIVDVQDKFATLKCVSSMDCHLESHNKITSYWGFAIITNLIH